MKKTTTILAILFATVFSVNAQNYYPEPRTGHTMTLIGNYIYMYGGETQAKQAKGYFVNDLSRFSIGTREWFHAQPVNSPPDGRQGHSAVAHEGNLYIIGGETANGMVGDIWKYNTATNTWEQLNTSGSNIPGRMQHGAIVEDGVLLIFGGSDGTNQLQDAYSVNLNNGTTTALPNIPGASGINGMGVFNNNGSPVVVGGQNSTGINSSSFMLNMNPVAYWGFVFGNAQGSAFPGTAISSDSQFQYICGGIVSIGNKNTEEYSSKLYRVSFSGNNINYDEITDNIPADTYFNRFVVNFEDSDNKSTQDTVFYFWGGANDDSFYKYTLYGDESEETIEIYNPETGDFENITTNILLTNDNKSLLIYPNPTNREIIIDNIEMKNITSISFYNIYGQEIMKVSNPANNRINIENFCNGTYFVEIMTKNSRTIKKIIKK